MKTNSVIWLIMSAILSSVIIVACQKKEDTAEVEATRNADPCNAWARPSWQTGPGAIITPEIRDGQASHMLSAKIIYYSVKENSDSVSKINGIFINPVLIITYLEMAHLLSEDETYSDFEIRLLQACGYGGEKIKKYHGFYPQLVAATYQWRLYQTKGYSFAEAQSFYPFDSTRSFTETYAKYARTMNEVAGTNFPLYPDSKGYFQDFYAKIDFENIQTFLERVNSPLRKDIFNQVPVSTTAINYLNMGDYCE